MGDKSSLDCHWQRKGNMDRVRISAERAQQLFGQLLSEIQNEITIAVNFVPVGGWKKGIMQSKTATTRFHRQPRIVWMLGEGDRT